MAKKYIHKALSVGLSLALCAGLVLPSFAASFTDLNNAINGGDYKQDAFEIADGKITLKEDVSYDEDKDGSQTDIRTNGNNVTLDLGGYTITGKGTNSGSSTIYVSGGSLTLEDSGRTDENGQQVSGKVTGGGNAGVFVDKGGSFEMKGGEISGNRKNTTTNSGGNGGGVVVTGKNSSFEMSGGIIKDNTANGSGGGVSVQSGATFTMTGGEISNNTANGGANSGGGGVHVWNGGQFTMDGGKIANNSTPNGAKGNGVAVHGSTFTMTKGEIIGGVTVADGGTDSQIKVQGGTVSSLDSKYLDKDKGLLANADGDTYSVVDHTSHTWGAWGAWTDNGDGTRTHTHSCLVAGCGASDSETQNIPSEPTTPTTPDAPVIDETVEIDDPAVPLAAGPVTRGEFIDYLWRHEGEPEAAAPTYTDVSADYEYAPAIGWAQSIGILDRVVSENSFAPDELVTVAAVRGILADFAQYAGMEMPELTTLAGEDDEAVLNCDEILAQFFGEELAA